MSDVTGIADTDQTSSGDASPPRSTPCAPWASISDVTSCQGCDDISNDVLNNSLGVATNILYRLSGQQFSGQCTDTIRPCGLTTAPRNIADWGYASGLIGFPGGLSGSWPGWGSFFDGGCGCNHPVTRSCGCDEGPSQFPLPNYPASSVVSVYENGSLVDPSEYRIDDWRWLVRLPNTGETTRRHWMCCQRMDLPRTAADTFQVTYTWGQPAPVDAVRACAELACELAKACTGGACRLPIRATQITREQLSMTFVSDVDAILRAGRSGLYYTDLFLASVNPNNIRQGAEVISPDLGVGSVRTTWP